MSEAPLYGGHGQRYIVSREGFDFVPRVLGKPASYTLLGPP